MGVLSFNGSVFSGVSQRLDTVSVRMWQRLASLGPYAPVAALFVVGLSLLTLSRALLMLWQAERVNATGIWMQMLLQGARVDLIQLCLLSLPLILAVPLLATSRTWTLWRHLSAIWVVLALMLLVLLEAATPQFIGQYDTRPDRLFIEYLKYPREVFSMLWGGFKGAVFGATALTVAMTWLAIRMLRGWHAQGRPWSVKLLWLSWPLVVLVCAATIRSTADHRPVNPATFALTGDPMVNTLILNSGWSVFHAVYAMRHEDRSSEVYGKMSEAEMLAELIEERRLLGDTRASLGDAELPTLLAQNATVHRDKPFNLVIVLEESLGATFVESLGGVPATPEIEKLKSQGWWFEQLYATGTRSVRGIEAVVAGFPPTPAQSVVKLSLAQRKFSTLASILATQGYESEFIYGGESHFDNMRGFFMGNGFSKVTDENDYEAPVFKGSWGVSDEDLLNRAHERLIEKHKSGKPNFTLIFSSSNHEPFEFPDGRITLYEEPKATARNAVKYADYAVGEFFRKAQASDYWKDTVFLLVADHDIRVAGDSLVPIEHFQIPGLILGAGIKPDVVKKVTSQIDLAPTLLSLLGVDVTDPMIGRDLTHESATTAGRAMMQYGDNYAWMEGDPSGRHKVVVLQPGKEASHGIYDVAQKRLSIGVAPEGRAIVEKRALAHSLLAAWLYREQRHRLPVNEHLRHSLTPAALSPASG